MLTRAHETTVVVLLALLASACASYESTTTFYRPDGSVEIVVIEKTKVSGESSTARASAGCYDHTTQAWTDDGHFDDGKAGQRAEILHAGGRCVIVRGGGISSQGVNGAAAVGGAIAGKALLP